jgi:hypothetical protein
MAAAGDSRGETEAAAAYLVVPTHVENEAGKPLAATAVLASTDAALGQFFTVLRQWTPETQQLVDRVVAKVKTRWQLVPLSHRTPPPPLLSCATKRT